MKKVIYTLILFFLLMGCKSQQSSVERFYSDTTIIKEIPKLVEIPGDTLISYPINVDSLVALLRAGVPPRTIEKMTIREDPETKNRVGILIDELGNLTALCEIQDRQIQVLEREISRIQKESEKTTIITKPGLFQRIKDAFDLVIYAVVITLLLTFILRKS